MPDPTTPTIFEVAAQYRKRLATAERAEMLKLVRAYRPLIDRLEVQINALTAELATMSEPTPWKVKKLERWITLQRQMVDEIGRFGSYVDVEISSSTLERIRLGSAAAKALTSAAVGGISFPWNDLPVEAIKTMLAFLDESSPLRMSLIEQLGPSVASNVSDYLLRAIALGINPNTIGAEMARRLGLGLVWAMRTARTAQLYAYREASRATYAANSDIVKQWRWHAQLDDRTCVSCLAMHGTLHDLNETLEDHHNGRCAMLPIVHGWGKIGFPGVKQSEIALRSGESWFRDLPKSTQIRMMGRRTWLAWERGDISFDQLSKRVPNATYGHMRVVPSLDELLHPR
jgi:hypothetical protein